MTYSKKLVMASAMVALAAGCGDDGGNATDAGGESIDAAGPDAGFNEAACPTAYGPTAVGSTFSVSPAGEGFDLNGDTTIDNNIGGQNGLRVLINQSFTGSLADGSLRTLTELRDFTAVGTDDSSVTVVLYGGIDSDDPAVLENDFDGDEDYYFDRRWVEPETCAPVASVPGSYAGGVVTGAADAIQFYIASLGGFVDFRKAKLSATIEAATKGVKTVDGMTARFGGAVPSCSLHKAPSSTDFNASALEDVVRLGGLQPDIDLDGDGLETILAEAGDGIISCTDGDGTVIEGADCGCDPRIADGFSIAFDITLVGAGILGPAPAE
ncbi:MAG TPA: hypothetical protein VML75_11660 [Kofleriaceae bacterium]|nr:hypothetical protein [Kofleriaceae bacterium]